MTVLKDIPFELDADALMKRVHLAPGSEDAEGFAHLLDQARNVANPKAVFRECFIEDRGEETVQIGGVTFTSRALRANLEDPERVFAFVATCGRELDRIALPAGDFLMQFWLDTIKASLLGTAVAYLKSHLDRRFALGKTATMSPGSGDATVWPISQQRELFALLGDVEAQIGVVLTESMLMVPNKTVSGVRFPTEANFQSCQLCHRDPCPGRRAPFDEALWETVAHGIEA